MKVLGNVQLQITFAYLQAIETSVFQVEAGLFAGYVILKLSS